MLIHNDLIILADKRKLISTEIIISYDVAIDIIESIFYGYLVVALIRKNCLRIISGRSPPYMTF